MNMIHIRTDNLPAMDYTVTSIDMWYDRHTRSWVVQRLNKDGYQIDNADYVYTKQEALEIVADYKKEYNII